MKRMSKQDIKKYTNIWEYVNNASFSIAFQKETDKLHDVKGASEIIY